MQEGLVEPVRHLTGSIGELVAYGTIGSCNAIVDGGRGGAPFQARLEAQVIEQSRFGEILLGDIASVMNALPPAHEVQQAVRVAVQGFVGQAADMLTVEIPIDPRYFPSGILLDHANGAVRT